MADAFAWSDELTSGVDLIDLQHKDLIKRINQFVAACEIRDVSATVGLLLRFLYIYMDDHFASEESMMQSSQYPEYDRHLAQHDYLRRELEDIKNLLAETGPSPTVAERSRKLLVDWFRNHILNTDKALANFLLGRKRPPAQAG
jgi:hemerythrin